MFDKRNMVKDLKLGFSTLVQSFYFVVKHKLWIYLLPSAILTVITYYMVMGSESTLDSWSEWAGGVWLIGGGLKWIIDKSQAATIFLLIEINKFIVLTLLSPLIAVLSEKTEKIITGNDYPMNIPQLIKDIIRGVLLSVRMIVLELSLILLWYIIAAIFGLKVLTPFVVIAISSYYYGFSFLDYVNERRRLSVKKSSRFSKEHFWLSMSVGAVFSLLFITPFIGMAFAAPICVIMSTLAVHELVDLNQNKFAKKESPDDDQASIEM